MKSSATNKPNKRIFKLVKLFAMAMNVTGLVYFWMKYMMKSENAFSVINHPWQAWVLKLHVFIAPLFVFIFGALFFSHVIPLLCFRQVRYYCIVATSVGLWQSKTAQRTRG